LKEVIINSILVGLCDFSYQGTIYRTCNRMVIRRGVLGTCSLDCPQSVSNCQLISNSKELLAEILINFEL